MITTMLLVQLQMLVVYIPCKPHRGKTKVQPTLLIGTAPVNTQSFWKFNQVSEPCKIVLMHIIIIRPSKYIRVIMY